MVSDLRERVKAAMESRRRELIAKPLAAIWDDLADAAIEAGAAWAEERAAKRIAEMNEIYKEALEQAMIPPAATNKEGLDNWQEPLAYFQERLAFILLEKKYG